MLVVGDKESEGGPLTVRIRGEADQKMMEKKEFIGECLKSIKERSA